MTEPKSSTQAAADLTEQEQYIVRQPGLWLEEPLSAQEVQEVCTLYGITKNVGENTDTEAFINNISPYMNSLVHMMYLLNKTKLKLNATESGIEIEGTDQYFDIVKYTVDFVIDSAGIDNGFRAFIGKALKEIIDDENKVERGADKTYSDFMRNEISVNKRMLLVEFAMDMLKDPEEALLNWTDLHSGNYETWYRSYHEKLAKGVAMQFGVDAEQVLNPETRTPEQERAMTELAGALTLQRLEKYNSSSYMQAVKALLQEESKSYSDTADNEEVYKIKKAAILYFFAQHPEKTPEATASLTAVQITELKDTYHSLEAYFLQETGGKEVDDITRERILFDFVQQQDSKTPEQKQEIITTLQTVIPQSHIMANNSLMHYLQNYPAINAGAFDLPVINKKGKRKEITAYTIVSYEQDSAGALISAKLTEYERQVSDAVISIWEEARKSGLPPEFTTDMLFRAMPGSSDKPSQQQAGAITRAIEKLRKLHIYLDVTDEMRARGLISDKDKVVYDDMFLSVGRVTRTTATGGRTVRAYHIHTEPLILQYCKLTKQLITVPPKWLEVKIVKGNKASSESMAMTQERQEITGYLMRRIAIMKNDKKNKKPTQSDTILFTTLFDAIGLKDPSRDKALDTRKSCFAILDYYKAEKIITDYEKRTKGRSVTGVKIIL